jgi:hypothetical protein
MSKLIAFRDTSIECWARVDLPDGSPLFISIAKTGVTIRKSKSGLFGPKLYEETVLHRIGEFGVKLRLLIADDPELPGAMLSPVLRGYTQIAMHSKDIKAFLLNIRTVENSDKSVEVETEEDILAEYGKVLESTSKYFYGAPVSHLPCGIEKLHYTILNEVNENLDNLEYLNVLRNAFIISAKFIDDEAAEKNLKFAEITAGVGKNIRNYEDIMQAFSKIDYKLEKQEEIAENTKKYTFVFDEFVNRVKGQNN